MLDTALPKFQPDALRRLLDSILAGDDVTLFIRSDDGRALLDEAAACLTTLRCRALRAAGTLEDGLSLPILLAQVTGQPYLSARNDEFLKQGFQALTTLDETCDRIVLLVSDANTLQPSALRYIQLACRAGTNLQLVLAGKRGFLDLLGPEEFAHLRKRLETGPIISPLPPRPAAAVPPVSAVNAAFPASDAPQGSQPLYHAPAAQAWEQVPEQIRLRPALPIVSSFSSEWYRRRRLVALTGVGLAVAGCIALAVWTGGVGGQPAPSQQAVLIMKPPMVPDEPAAAAPAAVALEPQPANQAAHAPEPLQPQPLQPEPLQPEPPTVKEETGMPVLPQPILPQLAVPPSVSTSTPPKSPARRSTPMQPRVASARAPTLNASGVAAWENPYPPTPREWRPPPAMSDPPEQPQSYIGTYGTDANGMRAFRFSR